MKLTKTEIRIITSLHLQGHIGHCGSLTKKQRIALLNSLIEKGMLDNDCNPTPAGIKASAPKFS